MKRLVQNFWSVGNPGAFSRIELLLVLGTLALLAAVTWPALAHTKPRADRVVCANNLRLVGRAEHIWASEHGDSFPWRVGFSNTGGDGGMQYHPMSGQAWFQYWFMSNELVTPAFLACPSDLSARQALDFSASSEGGFLNPNYRNNSVSYFIGLDCFLYPFPGGAPTAVNSPLAAALGGDQNLAVDGRSSTCSSGVRSTGAVLAPPSSRTRWTNSVHGNVGNILFVDGQVSQVSADRVAQAITPVGDDNGVNHILLSR